VGARAGVGSGSGLGNINLEHNARQDEIARVTRATVAEAIGGGHAPDTRTGALHSDRCTLPFKISLRFFARSRVLSLQTLESIGWCKISRKYSCPKAGY
jgi:hypothetical protein